MRSSRVAKRPYEPPRIRRVKLAGDELAAAACKSTPFRGSQILCQRNTRIYNRNIGS